MSCSKPLPPFTYDLLCFWNRDQLERFSVVCRSLKNFTDRYFHSKPYRIFDRLFINKGLYTLCHAGVNWQPNQDDYSAQQFLAGQICPLNTWHSFAEMRPYLGPTIRIKGTIIFVAGDSIFNPEHIAEMESIAYLWRDSNIFIRNEEFIRNPELEDSNRIVAEDFQTILNSPTILQCRELNITNPYFPFKDYKVLYTVKVISVLDSYGDFDLSYWQQFIEQPGVKPLVALHISGRGIIDNALDRLKEVI
ncbi:hypothetical protein Ddc_16635 [Ditylenchus destructor]|nr:hypothetical protein Ddc_16635 [Ditylenchus destructor]